MPSVSADHAPPAARSAGSPTVASAGTSAGTTTGTSAGTSAGTSGTAASAVREALLAPPPWLAAVADGAHVAAELTAALTAALSAALTAADGADAVPVRVAGCDLLDLRARGPLWKVRYRVALETAGERADVVLTGAARPPDGPTAADPARGAEPPRATGRPGGPEWHVSIPALGLDLRTEVTDRRLPAAAVLLDPGAALDVLADGLTAEYPGSRLAGCTPVAVRYLYGARCTVVYRLTWADRPADRPVADRARPGGDDLPDAVVAKAHADGQGRALDDALRAVWATPLARGDVVRVARPLGYLPGPRVLLQEALPGDRTLRDVLAGVGGGADPGPAIELLRRTADGLVALHGSGAAGAPPRTWDDDLDRARRTVARVDATWPAAADALTGLLDLLAIRAARTPPGVARPSHGAFRPSQVLVDGDRIAFLDLDGYCLAEAERDVGRFTKAVAKALVPAPAAPPAAHVRALELGRELAGLFLERYAARAPLDPQRVRLWEALDVLSGLAQTAATYRPGAEPLLRLLEDPPEAPDAPDAPDVPVLPDQPARA